MQFQKEKKTERLRQGDLIIEAVKVVFLCPILWEGRKITASKNLASKKPVLKYPTPTQRAQTDAYPAFFFLMPEVRGEKICVE